MARMLRLFLYDIATRFSIHPHAVAMEVDVTFIMREGIKPYQAWLGEIIIPCMYCHWWCCSPRQ